MIKERGSMDNELTKSMLREMLTENTGVHVLDSGGEGGRNWQINRFRNFDSESPTLLEIDVRWGINVQHNVYHWLAERLEYSEELDKVFQDWAAEQDKDKYWLELMEEFAEFGMRELGYNVESYGTVNTYNGEDLLSQVLQYAFMEVEDYGLVVLLQIHGGADVRGGYTKPRVFIANDDYSIFDNARAMIMCKNDWQHNWMTDDGGNHWYYDGSTAGTNLEQYERVEGEEFVEGKIVVTDDGRYLCPLCGGELYAGSY
jgi:hypothetical protein